MAHTGGGGGVVGNGNLNGNRNLCLVFRRTEHSEKCSSLFVFLFFGFSYLNQGPKLFQFSVFSSFPNIRIPMPTPIPNSVFNFRWAFSTFSQIDAEDAEEKQ